MKRRVFNGQYLHFIVPNVIRLLGMYILSIFYKEFQYVLRVYGLSVFGHGLSFQIHYASYETLWLRGISYRADNHGTKVAYIFWDISPYLYFYVNSSHLSA